MESTLCDMPKYVFRVPKSKAPRAHKIFGPIRHVPIFCIDDKSGFREEVLIPLAIIEAQGYDPDKVGRVSMKILSLLVAARGIYYENLNEHAHGICPN